MINWKEEIQNLTNITAIAHDVCSKCWKPLFDNGKRTVILQPWDLCQCDKKENNMDKGWICPKCDCGVSPKLTKCPCNDSNH